MTMEIVLRHEIPGVERMLGAILFDLTEKGNAIMADLQQVKDALTDTQQTIDAERAEVSAAVDGLTAQIAALEATVTALREEAAAGNAATPAQLDEVVLALNGMRDAASQIYTAPAPV